MVQVFKILNVCADRIQDNKQYVKPMSEILQICSKPFLKEKASDEMAYSQIVVESISQLGKSIHFGLVQRLFGDSLGTECTGCPRIGQNK